MKGMQGMQDMCAPAGAAALPQKCGWEPGSSCRGSTMPTAAAAAKGNMSWGKGGKLAVAFSAIGAWGARALQSECGANKRKERTFPVDDAQIGRHKVACGQHHDVAGQHML